jgi:hypothetical protein
MCQRHRMVDGLDYQLSSANVLSQKKLPQSSFGRYPHSSRAVFSHGSRFPLGLRLPEMARAAARPTLFRSNAICFKMPAVELARWLISDGSSR